MNKRIQLGNAFRDSVLAALLMYLAMSFFAWDFTWILISQDCSGRFCTATLPTIGRIFILLGALVTFAHSYAPLRRKL